MTRLKDLQMDQSDREDPGVLWGEPGVTTVEGTIVYTRDKSSGHVHKRIHLGTGLATLEGDNLDEAGAYEILDTLAEVDPSDLCQRCFPAGL